MTEARSNQSDPRACLLSQATLNDLTPSVVVLDAAQGALDAAKERRAAADANLVRLDARLSKLRAGAETSAAEAERQRLEALLAGHEPKSAEADDSELKRVEADARLIRGHVPTLDAAVHSAHIAQSLAFQAFRGEVHAALNGELQRRAAELRELAGMVSALRDNGDCERGFAEGFRSRAGSDAPQQRPEDIAAIRSGARGGVPGWYTLELAIDPAVGNARDGQRLLLSVAELVRGAAQDRANAAE